jgi:DNA-binding CsgD family transcriptional regulator
MLLEREYELDLVDGALRSARGGTGSLVVITGPLGIGKTELSRTLVRHGRQVGFRVLRASGALHERNFDFGVLRQLLDPVLNAAGPELLEQWCGGTCDAARQVFADEWLQPEPRWPMHKLEMAVHELHLLMAKMSAEQPLLILLDDLQWADTASLRWLSYLSKRMEGLSVTVVVTLLGGDPGAELPLVREISDSAALTLQLGRLSAAGARQLVHDQFGESGEEGFVRTCLQASAGNPMFLNSMLRDMKAAGRRPLVTEAEAVRSWQPSGWRERLSSCLNGQPPAVRALLQVIAVLRDETDVKFVAPIAGLDQIDYTEAVRVLRRLGLLTTESPPRAVQPAIRITVAELMTVDEVEEIHIRAATVLFSHGRPAEEVAAHLVEVASPLDESYLIETLKSAAEAVLERGEPETAASYLRRALLDSSADGEDRAELLVELATAERAFDPSASVRHVSQAVPILSSARERAVAVARLSPMMLASSAPAAEQVREIAREMGQPEDLSGAERELALRLEARRRYALIEDPAMLMDCVHRLRMMGPQPPMETAADRELVAVLLYAATIASEIGAAEVGRVANRILEWEPACARHVYTGLPLLVNVLVGADSLDNLSSWLDRVRQLDQHDEDVVTRTLVCTETAMLLMSVGKLPQALSYARKAIHLGGLDWEHGSSVTMMAVAMLAIESRDPELTRMMLEDCEPRAKGVCVVAALRLLQGTAVTARSELGPALQQILDIGRQLDQLGRRNPALCPWRGIAATLHHRLGNVDEANELIEQEYKLALEWGSPAAIGRAMRMQAQLSDESKDIELLREAIPVLDESANRLELTRTHLILGRRLRESGDPGAEEHLRKASTLADECGMQLLVDRANAELAVPAVLSTTPGPVLTPTEHRVAMLARSGLTNQEIAAEAQVTSRAVEKHLTKVYRKLGIRGRAELGDALQSQQEHTSPR